MNLATWSIRNPIPAILLFVMMTLAGLYGFRNLPVQNLPDIELPTVLITLSLPGAAPTQLETEVARKVENSLTSLAGLKHIRTSITDGLVAITAEFVLEKNLSDALIETKDAVDSVRADLPTELRPPTVSTRKPIAYRVATYAITSPRLSEEELSWFIDDTVSKTVLSVRGVGQFERVGGVSREVRVDIEPARLAALGATAADVSRALKLVQMESSGGRAKLGGIEQSVRTTGTVKQAADLNALPIALMDGRTLRLDQVADVKDGIAERTQAALIDGKPTVGFHIYRAKGFDEVKLGAAIEDSLEALKRAHPDLVITEVLSSVDFTLEQYHGSMSMLYEGALLAVIVVWLFLRDWRATLIAAAALPLSIIPTFFMMYWLGYALNMPTLLAQAVVVGILIDDAIVEIENVVRHRRMGKPIREAAIEAVNEIALAVTATTFTLIAVFLPISMMSGIPGLFFRQFGWTVAISVFVSLMVARLLTPMMAVYFLKDKSHHDNGDGALMSWYLRAVGWCLTHRKTTIASALGFFALSLAMAPLLPSGFIPPSDRGASIVSFELAPGSSLDMSIEISEVARRAIADIPGITHIFTTVGSSQSSGMGQSQAGQVRKGSLMLTLGPRGERASQNDIENEIRRRLLQVPAARFSLGGGNPGEKMAILLASDNAAALTVTARNLERQMRELGTLQNVSSTASLDRPEIVITPNAARAAELGITTQAISDTVRIATAGDFDAQLSQLNLDNRQVYIRVRVPDSARGDINTISMLRVPSRGGSTPLMTVADISTSTGPSQIDRYDRSRYVTVGADLGDETLSKAMADAMALPAVTSRPSSVRLMQTGDVELLGELFSAFGMAMLLGVLSVFCVLVLLFKDFFQPLTILSALPLSIGGAVIALLVTGSLASLPSLIGIVMLIGIVTKNSILLVEYTIVAMRDRGMSQMDAVVDSCHKRARPILMTTIAMIAGMTPIALGLGGDASFRQPMAFAVIGGLITSTALSLLVVPVTFTYVNQFENWVRGLLGRRHATV
jgi:multidrug efflux pump subunit AcrB